MTKRNRRAIIWTIWSLAIITLVAVVVWQVTTCYTTEAAILELRGEKIHEWCLG